LLPFVALIQQAELGVDELIVSAGRSAIEAVWTLSARQIAGPKHPDKRAVQSRAADHLTEGVDRGEQVRGQGSEADGGFRTFEVDWPLAAANDWMYPRCIGYRSPPPNLEGFCP